VHADIKPSNVMVEQAVTRLHSKLIDFGLSTLAVVDASQRGGTTAWAAPEASMDFSSRPCPSADVFSFGWLMHFVWTGEEPYGNASGEGLQHAILDAVQRGRVVLPEGPQGAHPFDPASRELCQSCLDLRPEHRPTMQAVQEEMSKWLDLGMTCDLGLDTAMAVLPSKAWDASVPWLAMAPRHQAEAMTISIQVDLNQDLEICFATKRRGCPVFGADCVGVNFSELLVEPGHFRIVTGAMRYDLWKTGACAPQLIHLGGVTLKSRSGEAGGLWDASMELFLPDTSGRISLRISALHECGSPPAADCDAGSGACILDAGCRQTLRL